MGNTLAGNGFSSDEDDTVEERHILQQTPQNKSRNKRPRSTSNNSCNDGDFFGSESAKRRRLKTTSRYIYETLFNTGQDFDFTLEAFDRQWKLHKIYLRQSPYFSAMFSGSWQDSNMNYVKTEISDPNITEKAMDITLGSMYQDEVTISIDEVISIVACASLFQLDGLIDQCCSVMIEAINSDTVIEYYYVAADYGLLRVRPACMTWLKVNLMHRFTNVTNLRSLSIELMSELIDSGDLYVLETEYSMYTLLKLWVFLKLNQDWQGNQNESFVSNKNFFEGRLKSSSEYFLDTSEGQPFAEAFKKLRLKNLVNFHKDLATIVADRIIPMSWLSPVFQMQWTALLKLNEGIDSGPQGINEAQFDKVCQRLGHTLRSKGQSWRWVLFNMGIVAVVAIDGYNVTLKRFKKDFIHNISDRIIDSFDDRDIMFKMSVASVNKEGQVIYEECSGLKSLRFEMNETYIILKLDPQKTRFPMLLSFRMLVNTPLVEEVSS